jgi:hypothetical protein
MTCRAPLLLSLLLLAVLAAAAVCSAAELTALPMTPANAVQSLPQQLLPPPIFLSTYLCTFTGYTPPCDGESFTCYVTCNVGQSCICIATMGQNPDGSCYIVRVSHGSCYPP